MCPRKEITDADPKVFSRVQHYRMALSWIPIPKTKFKDVLTRMHVPSVFMDMVKRPRTVFKKLKSSVQGQPCEGKPSSSVFATSLLTSPVYILSVDSILTQYTAMSVTYFPNTQQVFGLFLGYGSPDDVTNMTSKLFSNRGFVDNPFVLISAFLELERKHRLKQVDDMIDGLRIKISKGQHIQKSDETSDDQPETFYELYNQVGVLRSQLNMWKLQLDKLLNVCPHLPTFKTLGTEGFVLEPADYVTEVREIFEESAMRCENELAEVARSDSKVAIGDAQQMKAIALLTMFFLPATAVAGFMDAPVYDWDGKGHYFWYIAGPLTGAVMLMYFVWTTMIKTR
ncbi:hypothetical protein Neosp_005364 [[Neocosmospora] mangrovei]